MVDTRRLATSREFGAFAGSKSDGASSQVKKWNGAAQSSSPWDSLRKDSDLWYRNGNCLVYLYGQGQSRRGPSFRVPFQSLLTAKCYPLVVRFMSDDGLRRYSPHDLESWSRNNPGRTVELYIPPPARSTKTQALHYHLATRNFFAWIFRRSLVGEHLGSALVSVMNSMHEFRSKLQDNVEDLLDYVDEEGYLNLVNQPDHALAILHLAETFQMERLYIRAFAHCVGMNDRLFATSEYQHVSQRTKRLIRDARVDLDSRLYIATDMMRTLLDEELSESQMGIPSGARVHLENFRSFLHSFYTAQFGYYPPRSFSSDTFRAMREDFECLYELLVDDGYSPFKNTLPAVGGICTLQLIEAFDDIHAFKTLEYSLPLLPRFIPQNNSRRKSWFTRSDKTKADDRLVAHAALIKASNWRVEINQNELVKAYRKFEEDTALSIFKVDRTEKCTLADARKVRWMLIYGIYQALRSVTDEPSEVSEDVDAMYHLSINTSSLPPWNEHRSIDKMLRRQTDMAAMGSALYTWANPSVSSMSHTELKPDIDYFALTHKTPQVLQRSSSLTDLVRSASDSNRTNSITSALTRNSTIRKSIRMFKPATPPTKPAYHEIVVHGYGNGTNDVSFQAAASPLTIRSNSTASNTNLSTESAEGLTSSASSDGTPESSIITPSPTSPVAPTHNLTWPTASPPEKRREVVSMISQPVTPLPLRIPPKSKRRPTSVILEPTPDYAEDYAEIANQQRASFFGPRKLSLRGKDAGNRHSFMPEMLRWGSSMQEQMMRESLDEPFVVGAETDEWAAMQAFLDGDLKSWEEGTEDRGGGWEAYAELGGLTEMR